MLIIVLSGPRAMESQARTALAGVGFAVLRDPPSYGLPDFAHEDLESNEPQGFVAVEGDDIDLAHETVASLGWRLRMHHEKPEPTLPMK